MKTFASLCRHLGWAAPLVALSACQQQAAAPEAKPLVWVTTVNMGSSQATRTFSAVLQPRIESAIGFRVGGRISMRLVETGQWVKAGQTLAQLATEDLLTGLQAARQQVSATEAELQQLQADEGRLSRLSADGAAPTADLERQRTRIKATQAQLEAARQGMLLAQNRVQHGELKAPFDGVITQVMADIGQVVPEGQPMFMLARSGEIEAESFVPEDQAKLIQQSPATLVVPSMKDLPALPLKVREVSPVGFGPGRQVKVRYTLESNADKWRTLLRWGQTAEVHWRQTTGKEAVALPTGALVKREAAPYVWLVSAKEGKLVQQTVAVQRYTTDGVIVTGLKDGMQVVSVGAQNLVAGTAVTTRERTGTHLDLSSAQEGGR
jgi:membrane fusion protein, multidrug efflux system